MQPLSTTASRTADVSLEEHLAFERLLADLSARLPML
jgi:hypothetical protein